MFQLMISAPLERGQRVPGAGAVCRICMAGHGESCSSACAARWKLQLWRDSRAWDSDCHCRGGRRGSAAVSRVGEDEVGSRPRCWWWCWGRMAWAMLTGLDGMGTGRNVVVFPADAWKLDGRFFSGAGRGDVLDCDLRLLGLLQRDVSGRRDAQSGKDDPTGGADFIIAIVAVAVPGIECERAERDGCGKPAIIAVTSRDLGARAGTAGHDDANGVGACFWWWEALERGWASWPRC